MSALANMRINQSNINEHADSIEDDTIDLSSSGISVIARIDYIQRFSKQMTVVVDNNSAVYSKVARQYLANISQESSNQEMNVAFVAASSKINDIQMRCRMIEQLFANTLFDPEQSLAVSILRLAKTNNGIITVIVEHAQALSLQIKYELCQLVDTAKKTQKNINVVIFGLEQTAIEVGQNNTIFDKKISIVDATSGQVVALEHARFKNKSAMFKNDMWLKISLVSLFGLLILLVCWFLLSEHESFNFTTLPVAPLINEQPKSIPTIVSTVKVHTKQNKLASTSDIHLALLAQNNNPILPLATAKSDDILQALMLSESTINETKLPINIEELPLLSTNTPAILKQVKSNDVNLKKSSHLNALSITLNEQYYLNSDKGYVVQITGFSDSSRLEAFIQNNNNLKYFSYQKSFNGQNFFVLTTEIFSDQIQAREAMSKLPQSIKDLGSFLKPVSTIKREINTVNQ